LLKEFDPSGWNMKKIDACCDHAADTVLERQSFWNPDFQPVLCENIHDFKMMLGHEIAMEIRKSGLEGNKLAMILPVGPMGMYRWAVYFLTEWQVNCSHVYGFNMDEWSDAEGNTLVPSNPAAFQSAMQQAF
jgi:glucosamine-6-phosphate deaminase